MHHAAEFNSLKDTVQFIDRSTGIYRYPHFVCDSSGSICEVVDPESDSGGLLQELSRNLLLVWIREGPEHRDQLLARYRRAPKPMYYRQEFLEINWRSYLQLRGIAESEVDPDDFSCWIYEKALDARQSRYEAIARNWGVVIDASDVVTADSEAAFCGLICRALDSLGGLPGRDGGGR